MAFLPPSSSSTLVFFFFWTCRFSGDQLLIIGKTRKVWRLRKPNVVQDMFHLVKAEIAKAIIPKEFRLVEAFGWAARVYVNSDNACRHGRKEFGLPSQVATFSKASSQMIHVAETDGPVTTSLYDIQLKSPSMCIHILLKLTDPLKWMALGPKIKMSLPSFSGHTEHKPQLLKYSCQIECRVKPTTPARVLGSLDRIDASESQNLELNESLKKREMSISVMLSKPILALEFNCLKMEVQPPVLVSILITLCRNKCLIVLMVDIVGLMFCALHLRPEKSTRCMKNSWGGGNVYKNYEGGYYGVIQHPITRVLCICLSPSNIRNPNQTLVDLGGRYTRRRFRCWKHCRLIASVAVVMREWCGVDGKGEDRGRHRRRRTTSGAFDSQTHLQSSNIG
ncbi:hypothetical protein L1987_11195 [Smallanthus sonchifolius]|uniref:Uncharacterized protein n=1 Tax=Smallanthus sonchifolius TaxID=185202 RepID=A0ACB9JCC7_9ASTR|nr:hypothetical protein L1987_11195 [Smallanthus sonchifolius]